MTSGIEFQKEEDDRERSQLHCHLLNHSICHWREQEEAGLQSRVSRGGRTELETPVSEGKRKKTQRIKS